MSLNEAIWLERVAIVETVHAAIVHGMEQTWSRCGELGTSPQEPDFVAGLVLESCPRIHAALRFLLSPYRIQSSMLAVYCHQTPKVTFSGIAGTSCELGDLLFAHVHACATGHVQRNALLYQAKVSSSQPYRVPSGDRDQLSLYTKWPDFEYHKSPPFTGERRSVAPKVAHSGAQYMLIDDRPPDHPRSGLLGLPGFYPIGSCMPDDQLHDHNHLAAELLEFLLLRSGRPFADRADASRDNDWSRVVWDLLDSGVRKAFNRRRSGRYQSPRAVGETSICDGLSFTRSMSEAAHSTVADILGPPSANRLMSPDHGDVPPGQNRDREDRPESGSGVSVILLETSARREE